MALTPSTARLEQSHDHPFTSTMRMDNEHSCFERDWLTKQVQLWCMCFVQFFLLAGQIQNWKCQDMPPQFGWWERLIRSIRWILSEIFHAQLPTHNILTAMVAEAESILYFRSLIANIFDPKDDQALTSNHLLLLRESINLPAGLFKQRDSYTRRRWAKGVARKKLRGAKFCNF